MKIGRAPMNWMLYARWFDGLYARAAAKVATAPGTGMGR